MTRILWVLNIRLWRLVLVRATLEWYSWSKSLESRQTKLGPTQSRQTEVLGRQVTRLQGVQNYGENFFHINFSTSTDPAQMFIFEYGSPNTIIKPFFSTSSKNYIKKSTPVHTFEISLIWKTWCLKDLKSQCQKLFTERRCPNPFSLLGHHCKYSLKLYF